jgi:hypothetical protein
MRFARRRPTDSNYTPLPLSLHFRHRDCDHNTNLTMGGHDPPIHTYACIPPAPTEASAIFTPGPMVEEMEIFFM